MAQRAARIEWERAQQRAVLAKYGMPFLPAWAPPIPGKLTPRQEGSLRAYARHGTMKAAAHELGISIQTLKNHIHAAYNVLGVTTAIDAYRELGWLKIP